MSTDPMRVRADSARQMRDRYEDGDMSLEEFRDQMNVIGSPLRNGESRNGSVNYETRDDSADDGLPNGGGIIGSKAEADAIRNRHTVSPEVQAAVHARRFLIGRDTHDLPHPGDGRPLEMRHDLTAYLSQREDWNPSGIDLGSFDRDAFWTQLITRNDNGREYRALAEGAQSATFTNAGVLVPIQFAANVLEMLRANLVFSSVGGDGSVNGPMMVDMQRQVEYIPTWSADASGAYSYVGENPSLTPGTAALGAQLLSARTMASVQLASRQLVDDNATTGGLANLIESNLAAGIARAMDAAALYGTGTAQPNGLFGSTYSGTLQSVSMGTNGAAPTNFDPISTAIEKVRVANDEPTGIFTNPQTYGTFSRLKNTLNDAIRPGQDTLDFWPPNYSTSFLATETQGTSSLASSALVLNANRVILGMRQGLVLSILDQRYADSLQYGFLGYLRHDWAFPYSAAACRVQGILTT